MIEQNPQISQENEPRAWVIARGEWDSRDPVAAVIGTEDDAERCAKDYNSKFPWTSDADKARVWNSVPLITAPASPAQPSPPAP